MNPAIRHLVRSGLVLCAWSAATTAAPITYQGHLNSAGTPYTGPADLRFSVFNASTDGLQIGPTAEVLGAQVADGLFSVRFDVDDYAIAREAEAWLEIEANVGSGYETLTPRQPLDAAILAKQAAGAVVQPQLPDDLVVLRRGGSGQLELANTLDDPDFVAAPVVATGWQSFTPASDARLSRAGMQLAVVAADIIRFSIHEGEGTGGPILYSAIGAGFVDAFPYFGIEPPGGLTVSGGQIYTLGFEGLSADQLSQQTVRAPVSDTLLYAEGRASTAPGDDHYFIIKADDTETPIVFANSDTMFAEEFTGPQGTFTNVVVGDITVNDGLISNNPGAVDLGDNAIQPNEIEAEAGLAKALTGSTPVVLTNGMNDIEVISETIDAPAEGQIILMYTCEVLVHHVQGQQSGVTFTLYGRSRGIVIPLDRPTNTYYFPVSLHHSVGTFSGENTFSVRARGFGASPSQEIREQHFTVLYVPSSYEP